MAPSEVLPKEILERFDALIHEAMELRKIVAAAATENQRLDDRRVNPEGRTYDRAHAHDSKTEA